MKKYRATYKRPLCTICQEAVDPWDLIRSRCPACVCVLRYMEEAHADDCYDIGRKYEFLDSPERLARIEKYRQRAAMGLPLFEEPSPVERVA